MNLLKILAFFPDCSSDYLHILYMDFDDFIHRYDNGLIKLVPNVYDQI